MIIGGAAGIRTLDELLTHTHFPGERLRPLGHRSAYEPDRFVQSTWRESGDHQIALEEERPIACERLSQAGKLWQYVVMKTLLIAVIALATIGAAPAPKPALAPSEIVAAAPARDWVAIAPADLLVMTLGNGKRVVIQLMPPPFSQGWIGNIRKLATAHWWDGLSINRVQDNYVVQWGDVESDDKAKAKRLPDGMATVPESEYELTAENAVKGMQKRAGDTNVSMKEVAQDASGRHRDPYADFSIWLRGWPVAFSALHTWPVHCYGMVGVGRNLSPDTGSGAELYTVIGHAPRHLDRNIAVVGRVIAGIETLSSLPRGTGALGFYEKPEERVAITSIRLASELPATEQPRFEYLSTESESFAAYADARANRRDPFFIRPAGGADICNIPVPVRNKP